MVHRSTFVFATLALSVVPNTLAAPIVPESDIEARDKLVPRSPFLILAAVAAAGFLIHHEVKKHKKEKAEKAAKAEEQKKGNPPLPHSRRDFTSSGLLPVDVMSIAHEMYGQEKMVLEKKVADKFEGLATEQMKKDNSLLSRRDIDDEYLYERYINNLD